MGTTAAKFRPERRLPISSLVILSNALLMVASSNSIACRARPSVRSAISLAACTLPRTASRTCASAINSAHVRFSGSLGRGSSSLFL